MKIRGIELRGGWKPEEIKEVIRVLGVLPASVVEDNPSFTGIIRRSVLNDGPPEAPGHSKYEPSHGAIVVYDKGVYHGDELDPEQFRRSIYHELAHSILRSNPGLVKEWQSATSGDGYVDDYAKTSPDEDFCDSFSEFLIDRPRVVKELPKKSGFLARLLESDHQEKMAMYMISGFADELTKVAAFKDIVMKAKMLAAKAGTKGAELGRKAGTKAKESWAGRESGKVGVGKALLGAGALSTATYGMGRSKGRKKGRQVGQAEGVAGARRFAQRAHQVGLQRGYQAGVQRAVAALRQQQQQAMLRQR